MELTLQMQHQQVSEKRMSNLEHSKITIKHTIKTLENIAITQHGDSKSRINNQIANFNRILKELQILSA